MPAHLPGPVNLDAALGDDALNSGAAFDHWNSDHFLWVTTHAHHGLSRWTPARWVDLPELLPGDPHDHVRLELDAAAPGARGRLRIHNATHQLICATHDASDPGTSLLGGVDAYPHAHPIWIANQPGRIRALLRALRWSPIAAPTYTREPRQLKHLDTDRLARVAAPLLGLPTDIAETFTAAVNAHPADQPPALTDVLDLARALQAS